MLLSIALPAYPDQTSQSTSFASAISDEDDVGEQNVLDILGSNAKASASSPILPKVSDEIMKNAIPLRTGDTINATSHES